MKLAAINTVLTALALLVLLPAHATYPAFTGPGSQLGLELEAVENVLPGPLSPPVEFVIQNSEPQGDLFSAVSEDALGDISAWQIQIFDQSGRKVSFIQGRNRPSRETIIWDGLSSSGEPLPDGFYDARLVWLGPDNRPHMTQKISVNLSTPLAIRKLAGRNLRIRYAQEGLVIGMTEDMIFKPGETVILEAALPALREISLFLRSYPDNRVIIRGYTDSSGSLGRNLSLSRERAAGVRRFLIKAGVDPVRLAYKGLGPANPVATNKTETGRAKNRRVEVIVLKTAL